MSGSSSISRARSAIAVWVVDSSATRPADSDGGGSHFRGKTSPAPSRGFVR